MAGETAVAKIAQAGKYLSFILGREEYGLEILKVQEINGMMGITRVPGTPDHVRGVINLRGRVIPVVSLRRKFRMPDVEDTEKTCIIVVQIEHGDTDVTMGLVVDEVSEVLSVRDDQIEEAPNFGGGMDDADYIMGMGKLGEKVVILLDIDAVMNEQDLDDLARMNQQGQA